MPIGVIRVRTQRAAPVSTLIICVRIRKSVKMNEHNRHEHNHDPSLADKLLSPEDVTPGDLARADQRVAALKRWLEQAKNNLIDHIEHVHGDDMDACAAYCGDTNLFVNVELLDVRDARMMVLVALHELIRADRGKTEKED